MRVSGSPSDEMRPMLLALVATVVLHAVLGVWLSEPHRFALRLPVVVPRVSVTALPVDPAKLPASMRVAETTSQGNREVPADTSLVAARNQSAAQPVPEKVPTRSALPRSQGESADSLRLAQAVPRKVEEVMDAPAKAEAGTPRVAVDPTPAAPSPQPRPPAAQPATPRVSLPSGTSGLLLRNPVGVNRAGAVSLDARFSSYGDYSQRMLEAIQGSWWGLIDRTHLDEFSSGYVVVRFRIHRDGTITDAEVVASTVPSLASLICKDAILLPAPYDTWRADMVAMLGEDETVTITFHYR